MAELNPRSQQILELRLVTGLSREECAAFYGISVEPFEVALLRSGQELSRGLSGAKRAPPEAIPFAEELFKARALSDALETGDRPAAEALGKIFDDIQRVRSLASEIRSQTAAAELEAQTSAPRRNMLWRLLLLALLGAAALLYLRPG
jgi:hypothetical protein